MSPAIPCSHGAERVWKLPSCTLHLFSSLQYSIGGSQSRRCVAIVMRFSFQMSPSVSQSRPTVGIRIITLCREGIINHFTTVCRSAVRWLRPQASSYMTKWVNELIIESLSVLMLICETSPWISNTFWYLEPVLCVVGDPSIVTLFIPEDGSDVFLRNVCNHLED